ncbi:ABC transporter permease [Streptomyces sp. RFCAC02]|uniref:ABC transporter permease n=1 Tax=Streptomyces sp. RFCAC02 TaxID=2499143 RepID=UPI00101F746D|nr:ABC transporter permease [Streptomyces sp. RFCAC02]
MTALLAPDIPAPARRRVRNPYIAGLRTPRGIAGLVLVGLVAAAGLLAPVIAGPAPTEQSADALTGPGAAHLLGTDEVGRDLLSRVLYGIRTDLGIILVGVPVAAVGGSVLALAATAWRPADVVVQRLFDLVLAFPGLILGLAITAVLGPGYWPVILVIALAEAPGFGRVLRGSVLLQREREYAVAARAGGAGPVRVLLRHVLPNAVDPVVVQLAVSLPAAVFIEGAMSFLGIGVKPPDPTLGSVLSQAMPYLSTHPHIAVPPLVAVTALVLGFTLIAEALNKGVRR